MRGVTFRSFNDEAESYISTHTPHARRDHMQCIVVFFLLISTHTPHARRDSIAMISLLTLLPFLLTRLMRGVTITARETKRPEKISTHTPHARRDHKLSFTQGFLSISTHTPHARRDVMFCLSAANWWISTHTPHARRDRRNARGLQLHTHFYSHASCEA